MDLPTARAVYWDYIIDHCLKAGMNPQDQWCPYRIQHEIPIVISTKNFYSYRGRQRKAIMALAVICRALPVVVRKG